MVEEDEEREELQPTQEDDIKPGEPTTSQLTEALTSIAHLSEQLEEYNTRPHPRNLICPVVDGGMLVEKSVHKTESSSSSEGDEKDHDEEDELFQALYQTPNMNEKYSDLFKHFLGEKPSKKKTFDKDTFPNKAMRELFIKYNTPIPSSATVERMFFMGKDVLRPKRSRMSDKHFEMLVILRGNK
ncbi:hypothetical protein Hamer_G009389 [Homarus americanus]|uniref:HAT C-terminal dimerisation domain-containing protein n=1 Tax=Homarus americanus TaxID=6706 RepID=A0A8J5J7W4_HOMAM|nr:hypothetical protein Hamer_G009389 [Homarus americanus]